MAAGVIWLRLASGAGRATVLLAPEAGGGGQAFSRGAGRRLVHLERKVPAELVPSLTAMADTLARAGEETDEALVPRMLGAAATTGASVRLLRTVPVGQSFPRWDARLRNGVEPDDSGRFWPAQAEEVALDLGLRDAIKREGLSAEALATSRRLFDLRGYAAAACADVLLVARDSAILAQLVEAETELQRGGASSADAITQLGKALGYPKCCVEAFRGLGSADDLTLAAALLPPLQHTPASPFVHWLIAPLALVSHSPCSLLCAGSRELARAILAGIETLQPGFSARWLRLVSALHVVDVSGRCFVMDVEGRLDTPDGVFVRRATELVGHSDAATLRLVPVPEFTDQSMFVTDGRLRGNSLSAAFVADHRAAVD